MAHLSAYAENAIENKQAVIYNPLAQIMLSKDDLQQIGKVIDSRLDDKLEPIKKDIKTIKAEVTEQGKKLDVAIERINHVDTGVKALDAKVDATKSQLERKINKLPQKAD